MRKTCILIFSIVVAFTSRAQMMSGVKNNNSNNTSNGNTYLSITNLSAEDIQFEVDGQQYVGCGFNLNIQGLRPGNHQVVLFTGKKGGGFTAIKRILIYNQPVMVKPQFYVDIIINRFGRVLIDEQSVTDNQYLGNGQMIWRNPSLPNVPPPPPPPNNQPGNNWNNQPGNNWDNQQGNNWPHQGNYNNPPRPMPDNTFNSFIETVRRESFDDSRMAIAKAGIDQNFFTSNQAKALLSVFSFEASKLQIAKYMYGKTTDPKNYFVVYNVFTFSKSKEELADYVRNYR
ncbi:MULTISPECIES: DUF4476 domain-containing protein [Niastella]|uniref:DUF4476 domain-containing protein n=1 Tax=Niastella soli TaxID=2821487 RepID=A0ABS3YSZ3_9BACT|nr:DUF4476 domain-containing protein [Niastella soli]MBO9200908.1 DUF4476 domain-containing protein [Niastella soli]